MNYYDLQILEIQFKTAINTVDYAKAEDIAEKIIQIKPEREEILRKQLTIIKNKAEKRNTLQKKERTNKIPT